MVNPEPCKDGKGGILHPSMARGVSLTNLHLPGVSLTRKKWGHYPKLRAHSFKSHEDARYPKRVLRTWLRLAFFLGVDSSSFQPSFFSKTGSVFSGISEVF